MLSGVNVALGVTGSIAAVRVVELVHELQRKGASVRGITTESATGIIHPWAIEFATGHPVVTEITGGIEHVELCGREGWADVLLIAPATANTIGKIAGAIDDTPVTTCATTALGADVPVVIAPAMHEPMYDHPGVIDSIERLEEWDVSFVDPRIEEGKAKIAEHVDIALDVGRTVGPHKLDGKHVVVTAGGTVEAIDPLRILTSRASGKTGLAVGRACYARGASVTLVAAGMDVNWPAHSATVRSVETAEEMQAAVETAVDDADALVSAAAISDYSVDTVDEKIRSGQSDLKLSLQPTPKLLDSIREDHPDLPIVGFKAETGSDDASMIAEARRLLDRVRLAFVVANDASVMGTDETAAVFVEADSETPFEGSKDDLGLAVADKLATHL